MEANDYDDPPATSRSEEISARSIREPRTARDRAERLVDSLQELVDDVAGDPKAGTSARVACLRAMTGPLRLLATLTGEAGASDAQVASSPFYRRVRTVIVEALRGHPEAARSVITALDRLERGGAVDLESAAE